MATNQASKQVSRQVIGSKFNKRELYKSRSEYFMLTTNTLELRNIGRGYFYIELLAVNSKF